MAAGSQRMGCCRRRDVVELQRVRVGVGCEMEKE
jgi:hypothetical protein